MGVKKKGKKSVSKKKKNKLPKWYYSPLTKRYEMNETKNGITYGILLDEIQWLSMMSKCNNRFERALWLKSNKKIPKPIKNV